MWLEITLIPFIIVLILFFVFWIVHEGSRWQKHRFLGVFARIIQVSPGRTFLIFFLLTMLLIPLALLVMIGQWMDTMPEPQKADIVNIMLLALLVLAAAFPIMWGSFRTWRQAKRAEADLQVRPTAA